MKLTKAQQKIVNKAKEDIDYARSNDFIHWVSLKLCGYDMEKDWDAVPNPYLSNEYVLKQAQDLIAKDETGYNCFEPHHWAKRYERAKHGECIAHANSKTLEALARMGVIEIIHDGRRGWDTIRLLDY